MSHYHTHSHLYYNEDDDCYRLSMWTYKGNGDESMSITVSLQEQDLALLETQIKRGRGQKAVHLEDPITAQKEESHG